MALAACTPVTGTRWELFFTTPAEKQHHDVFLRDTCDFERHTGTGITGITILEEFEPHRLNGCEVLSYWCHGIQRQVCAPKRDSSRESGNPSPQHGKASAPERQSNAG